MTTCFVIGPIGQEHAELGSPERKVWESSLELYEGVIQAACTFLGIEAVRADQISISGDITDQIFRRLYESDLVIADITGANANVMYELGLRHSLKALTIQVADADTPLPFDVKAVRTIMVNRSQYGLITARKQLTRAIEMGLEGNVDMVSATRVWETLRNAGGKDLSVYLGDSIEAPEKVEERDEEDSDGYIEIILGLSDSLSTLTASTVAIGECLTEMNAETNSASQEMNNSSSSLSDTERLGIIRRFATTLGNRASTFDRLTSVYESDLHAIDNQVSPLLVMMSEYPSLREQENSRALLDSLEQLPKSARDAFEGLSGFSAAASQLSVLSKMLREPTKLIVRGIARMADSVSIMENWEAAVNKIKSND